MYIIIFFNFFLKIVGPYRYDSYVILKTNDKGILDVYFLEFLNTQCLPESKI